MIISNTVNERVWPDHYKYDPVFMLLLQFRDSKIDLPDTASKEVYRLVTWRRRFRQEPDLLQKLHGAIVPCRHGQWLATRHICDTSEIYAIDHSKLSTQDMLDLCIYPDDHILDKYGEAPVDGPVFLDVRAGDLVGVCIRNVSANLDYVAEAKYTFSNYGWFLYGYDLYEPDDEIFIVEGVFDALAMRRFGYKAIAIGASSPQYEQLACLRYKFKHMSICFDNDMFGRYGAYCAGKMLNAPVFFPELKDIGCHFEANVPIRLNRVELDDLYCLLVDEIYAWNKAVKGGWCPTRPLPYNSRPETSHEIS